MQGALPLDGALEQQRLAGASTPSRAGAQWLSLCLGAFEAAFVIALLDGTKGIEASQCSVPP